MNVAVIGASGYVGAELIGLLAQHDKVSISHLVVSENSTSNGSLFSELFARWQGICDVPLQSFSKDWFNTVSETLDAVFFATPHEFSAQWAQAFVDKGVNVYDLSGGFRLKNTADYPTYYGFEHQYPQAVANAKYGLAEWFPADFTSTKLVAVPGCYPTASLLSLKPITAAGLHQNNGLIVVNGVSGVSGAGRKASLATSFNEVSLRPYNILQHRHQPEISQEAGTQVIFNPHLAPYKRGLLTTVTLNLKKGVTTEQVNEAFVNAYQEQPLVRIKATWPQIDDVAHTPFADIHWQYDEKKQVLVVTTAIDNLLKGAASQAVQCMNATLGLPTHYGLVPQLQGAIA
ncbi:N-acetyl-gamma-glutamyl-phosphate reductase [Thalassotalea euphylliae]|uniref:N-acetyl-gamma-glutamyl-phosphate reductase n=1 Tax=Thalassotalea euphylliae TaxID=1655234 RepID=UPI0036355FD9